MKEITHTTRSHIEIILFYISLFMFTLWKIIKSRTRVAVPVMCSMFHLNIPVCENADYETNERAQHERNYSTQKHGDLFHINETLTKDLKRLEQVSL